MSRLIARIETSEECPQPRSYVDALSCAKANARLLRVQSTPPCELAPSTGVSSPRIDPDRYLSAYRSIYNSPALTDMLFPTPSHIPCYCFVFVVNPPSLFLLSSFILSGTRPVARRCCRRYLKTALLGHMQPPVALG